METKPLNPLQAFARGYRLAVSNLELAVIYFVASVCFALSLVVPLGLFVWQFLGILERSAGPAAAAPGVLLTLEAHWSFIAMWALGLSAWMTAASLAYLLVKAGILGQLARGCRIRSSGTDPVRTRLGFTPAVRVYSWRGFIEDARTFGGRLVLLASFYGFLTILGVLFLVGVALAAFHTVLLHRWVLPLAVAAVLLLSAVLALVALILGLHYRLAAALAVGMPCAAKASVSEANRVIGRAPMPFLGLCGLALLLSWTVGAVFAAAGAPVGLLALVRPLMVLMISLRILFLLIHSAAAAVVFVVTAGAFMAFALEGARQGEAAAGRRAAKGAAAG